jgi:hypothetical protein
MCDIEKLATTLMRLSPHIPLTQDLWSTKEIAYYLKRSENVVRDHIVHLPDFPPAYRLPSRNKRGRGHPLWRASEVMAWAQKFREKR